MANLPLILSLADDLNRLSMAPQPLYISPSSFYNYRYPYMTLVPREQKLRSHANESLPVSTIGKDGYQVCMNVSEFKPSELNVKVVDNCVVIEGKHKEREDEHGHIFRHFVRRYSLPKGYDADKLVTTLSSDGVLTVSVPKPQIEDTKSNERVIHIQQVGPAHLNVKENSKDEEDEREKEQDKAQAKL